MDKQILFRLGDQFFSIPITDTEKITRIEKYTVVPDVSPYIIGVQDVEGKVVPLINLANRFYQKDLEDFEQSDVIIAHWKDAKIGLVVDEVTAVKTFEQGQWSEKEETEEQFDGVSSSYIRAFFQTENGIIPILSSHALFSEEKAEEIRKLLEIEGVKE